MEVALRETSFAACQRPFPRQRTKDQVVIVGIDERSIDRFRR
jgi:CHASE2 domain-containing sensor protein